MLTAPKFANLMLSRVAIMPGMSPKIANPCTAGASMTSDPPQQTEQWNHAVNAKQTCPVPIKHRIGCKPEHKTLRQAINMLHRHKHKEQCDCLTHDC